jgi:ArsR family transcriptional regulator
VINKGKSPQSGNEISVSGLASSCPEINDMKCEVAATALAALGHILRIQVWRMLAPYGPAGLPAGAISSGLAVPPSSLSFHLQQMIQAQILVQRRSRRQIIYAVNNDFLLSLCDFLANPVEPMIQLSAAALASGQLGDITGERPS